jgi:hypothetical protein
MNLKGYVGKDLYILDVQLNLLKELIKVESKNVLSELLTKKTYYRLLKSIDKGIEYLPDLVENNENYVLNPIDRDKDAWISDDVLIFSCKSGTGVFSKVSRKTEGANYIDNRYQ